MIKCHDQEWYLSFLIWVPASAFFGALVFTLWTGRLYARGPIHSRDTEPSTYWVGVGFIAVCMAVTISFALDGVRCEGWPPF